MSVDCTRSNSKSRMNTSSLSGTPLLTPEDAAELLGVNPQTLAVWRSTKRYSIPYIKIGRTIRYAPSDLEDYLAQQRVPGPSEGGDQSA